MSRQSPLCLQDPCRHRNHSEQHQPDTKRDGAMEEMKKIHEGNSIVIEAR